jgi:hypothetical protein
MNQSKDLLVASLFIINSNILALYLFMNIIDVCYLLLDKVLLALKNPSKMESLAIPIVNRVATK